MINFKSQFPVVGCESQKSYGDFVPEGVRISKRTHDVHLRNGSHVHKVINNVSVTISNSIESIINEIFFDEYD